MLFKNWLFTEELFPNKTATVFHRTRDITSIEKTLHSGFKPGGGCMYGCGLYTTFDLKSQFRPEMQMYGEYIVKFKVTNLENYLITPISVAKYVLKDKYKISDQFKKFGYDKLPGHKFTTGYEDYDLTQEVQQYSSDLAVKIYQDNRWIEKTLSGIIYNGRQDGYCLVKYEPINDGVVMLGYAHAPESDQTKYNELASNKGWITSSKLGKIKHFYAKGGEIKKDIKVNDIVYIIPKPQVKSYFLNMPLKVLSVNDDQTVDVEYGSDKSVTKFPIEEVIPAKPPQAPKEYRLSRNQFESELESSVVDPKTQKPIAYKLKLFLIKRDPTQENIQYILKRYPDKETTKVTIETLAKRKPNLITPAIIREIDSSAYDIYDLLKTIIELKPIQEDTFHEIVRAAFSLKPAQSQPILKLLIEKVPELSQDEKQDIIFAFSGAGRLSDSFLEKSERIKKFDLNSAIEIISHLSKLGYLENVTSDWIKNILAPMTQDRLIKPEDVAEITKAFFDNKKMNQDEATQIKEDIKSQFRKPEEAKRYVSALNNTQAD